MRILMVAVALAAAAAVYVAATRRCESGLHWHRHWRGSGRHDRL